MKRLLTTLALFICLTGISQKRITINGGAGGGGGSMVYPGAGIPLSTGTAWGTSITDNSANWNTAYGWGNHSGLYFLLSDTASKTWSWSDITGAPSFLTSYTETDPLAFKLTDTAAKTWDWLDITGTPAYLLSSTAASTYQPIGSYLNTGLAFLLADTAAKTWDWLDITGKPTFGTLASQNGTITDYLTIASASATYEPLLGFTPYNATNPNNYIPLTALSSTAIGLTYTNTTGVFSLTAGYVIPTTTEQTNWETAYTNRITSLTTTGSSGASTLSSNTLNIPNYTLAGLGGQPALSGTGFVKISGTTISYDNSTYLTSEVDGSTTNELQTITSTNDATSHTVTLSNTGGSIQLVEGSNITLTTTGTGADGIVTIASTGSGVTDGDKGDITVGTGGTVWTVDNTAITYAKIQNVAANSFLANLTGAPASLTEVATNRIPLFASAITGTPDNTTYLRGDGTWATAGGGGSMATLSDVVLTSLAGEDFLKYDGGTSKWINRTPANVRTDLSLNNVTNESKATMFTSPTFTGNAVLGAPASGDFSTGTFTWPSSLVTATGTTTLTNKRITARTGSTTSSATPTINTDNVDKYELTAQTVDITSFTTNLSGTPTDGQRLIICVTGTASRAITWGASFEASSIALPTTTSGTSMLCTSFVWNTATSKWRLTGWW